MGSEGEALLDGVNALISLARGDTTGAWLSAWAMLPVAGVGATTLKWLLKWLKKADKASQAATCATRGGSSLYDDVTRAGSRVANRATDVTKSQFEKNLIDSGFTRSLSKDGKAIILEKDGAKYILRDGAKSTGGPTADFYKAGSTSADLKIRLEQGAP
ncbi:hypothetical protein J8C06_09645 [Chloracidobacterium validum]|uniref:Uncharacterized protein n=1 Tax=Chloracidobacterium validum TaxID=2821543 RepID=A0ABX8B7E6_9BACT|nr:hypothetical protein [Chloracidobacterium validum]QUW02599.1 hypothetical protein J8C06_09645 [Chloracidobacterium validum]